jgi:hypothetical protein
MMDQEIESPLIYTCYFYLSSPSGAVLSFFLATTMVLFFTSTGAQATSWDYND